MITAPQQTTARLASDLAESYLTTLSGRAGGEKHHIASGLQALDDGTPGWLHKGHLIVIAARPAMGKSALSQQIVESAAAGGRTALLLTLEMSASEITERAVARRSGVPLPLLQTGEGLGESEWARITQALADFAGLPLLVDDNSFDIEGLVSRAKSAAARTDAAGLPPLGLIAVDYIQLVGARAANRNLEIGLVSGSLKRLAKDLQCPVIALSQLNRGVEGRTNRRPTLADLRESGAIEQDADMVLFLYRDEYYDKDSPDRGTAEAIIAKNRHGRTGTVRLSFDPERVAFGDPGWAPQYGQKGGRNADPF